MLPYPMKRARPKGDADPGWVRITWEALELTASRLLDIKAHELLPPEQAARRLGAVERPLEPAGNPGLVPAYDSYGGTPRGTAPRLRTAHSCGMQRPQPTTFLGHTHGS
jgi:anaerobic selenocysteine-containing dehydrogenase